MNRCTAPSMASWRNTGLGLLLASSLWTTGQAQNAPRPFPAQALRGTLVVVQPPVIQLDGQPARLSPGSRIRSANNMLVLSGSLVNQELTVNYTLEPGGMVHDVWILTEAEAAEKRPTAADRRN